MTYQEIKNCFETKANYENSLQMTAYMKNQFHFFGLKTPSRRACYHQFLKDSKKSREIDWNFLNTCWSAKEREFQYLVIDYLKHMEQQISMTDFDKVEHFVRTKQWWDSIDPLSKIIGRIGQKDEEFDSLMREWSTDHDFWIRRVAILHQLHFKDETNAALLEEILLNNLGSNEFFINKAIGWALREYSKTHSNWVREFIENNYESLDKLSIREGSKYI